MPRASWELLSKPIQGVAAYSRQVEAFQARRDALIKALGAAGTEIERHQTLEVDEDIEPKNFTRDSTRVFIFPPQPGAALRGENRVIPGTPPYTLTRVNQMADYDRDLVRGQLRVNYADAGQQPMFFVVDELGSSELPNTVLQALASAVKQI